jgi:hypothetical protein
MRMCLSRPSPDTDTITSELSIRQLAALADLVYVAGDRGLTEQIIGRIYAYYDQQPTTSSLWLMDGT